MLHPMLANPSELTDLSHVIDNDNLVVEQKVDGHRLLATSSGGDFPPTFLTRNGTPYSKRLPESLRNLRFPFDDGTLPVGAWVLDGELVGDTYWVFDILAVPTVDLGVNTPLRQRRAVLEAAFAGDAFPGIRLVPQAKTREEKIALAEVALRENFEGLMIKKADSLYISGGRTDAWLKLKFVTTADVIVLDVRDDGKESVRLGLFEGSGWTSEDDYVNSDDNHTVVEVGRASLIGKEKNGVISKGDVIEVRYLYTGNGGRLYQPTIVGRRADKKGYECGTDQLKYVNKEVLVSL